VSGRWLSGSLRVAISKISLCIVGVSHVLTIVGAVAFLRVLAEQKHRSVIMVTGYLQV